MRLEVQINELKKCAAAQEMLTHRLRIEQQRISWLRNSLNINLLGAKYDLSGLEEMVHRQVVFSLQLSNVLEQIEKTYARTEERLLR